MLTQRTDYQGKCWMLQFFLLQISLDVVCSQLHYIIPEESKHGTFVGRIAQDLGLEMGEINSRMLRIVSRDEKEYFQVNLQNGILFVKESIDRESLCANVNHCIISLQVIVDKPVQMYRIDVEIQDINDNYPVFSANEYSMSISELRLPGFRFPLEGAVDLDIGTNSITNYELSANDYFILEFSKYVHQIRTLELVLKKSLDREKISVHNLTLTAFDGGKPKLSGTTQLTVMVEDANDNGPTFDQPFYQCNVIENADKGTLLIKLNATDLDQGRNGEITYEFSKMVTEPVSSLFNVNKHSGEIRLQGEVDFERTNMYEIHIDVFDNGYPPLTGHCKVIISILDINDNPPELAITSLSVPVPEDAPKGTTVAIISVHDRDSGANGRVTCHLSEPSPFKIIPAFTGDFSLTVDAPLDRESTSEYEVVITAKDEGSPVLSVSKAIKVDISDVNDNAPQFIQPVNTIFVRENNPPGALVYTVSALDIDINQNSFITYSLSESAISGIPLSSYMSINPENGNLFALLSFDHEQLTYFQCHIKATDAGLPPLGSNLTLNVFIVDVNDNAPTFDPLSSLSGSTEIIRLLKSAKPGSLVTKIKAVDLDSAYNAWLYYEFKETAKNIPFRISHQTGEITLTRSLSESDSDEYRLLVVAQDHGKPAMSTTAQIIIYLMESEEDIIIDQRNSIDNSDDFSNANIYLVIAICSISSIFLITLIAFTVLRWQKYRDEVNCLKESYKICSNTGGSWIYSQQNQCQLYINSLQRRSDLIVFTPSSNQTSETEENIEQPGLITNTSNKVRALIYIIV
ncbi:protocadherin alpha-8-like [Discoglossus pictus]